MAIYDSLGNLIALSKLFGTVPTGLVRCGIEKDGAGGNISQIALTAGTAYYLAVWMPNTANGCQFLGRDNGATLGGTPLLAIVKDNQGTVPPAALGTNESQYRLYVAATPISA